MALRAASSLMSYTGPDGCNHSRPVAENEDGSTTAADEWVLECGNCEASLSGHELWGPADAPRPLTADEQRLQEAQQADANRNVLSSLAAMPQTLADLAMQNQVTMQILVKALEAGTIPGIPAKSADQTPAPAGAPAAQTAPLPADGTPADTGTATPTPAEKRAATIAAKKAAADGDASAQG